MVQLDEGAWRPHGDPMEAAIDVFARRLGLDAEVDASRLPRSSPASRSTPGAGAMSVVDDDGVVGQGRPRRACSRCAATVEGAVGGRSTP